MDAAAEEVARATEATSRYLEVYQKFILKHTVRGPEAAWGDLENLEIYLNLEIYVETNGFKVEITNPAPLPSRVRLQ